MKLTAIIVAAWCAASVATAALWSRWRRCVPSVAALAPPQAARPAAHTTFTPPTVLADLVAPGAHLYTITAGNDVFVVSDIELVNAAVQVLAARYPTTTVTIHATT